jgi:hypothetical protein
MAKLDLGEKLLGAGLVSVLVGTVAYNINGPELINKETKVRNTIETKAPAPLININIKFDNSKKVTIINKNSAKSYNSFVKDLAERESSNRPYIINEKGYVGLFQMGRPAMMDIGYPKSFYSKVLKDPTIWTREQQLEDFDIWVGVLQRYLKKEIKKYEGKKIHGHKISESGLIAAAHLVGAGSVKTWIRTGKVSEDGNGIKLTSYLNKFNGYSIKNS